LLLGRNDLVRLVGFVRSSFNWLVLLAGRFPGFRLVFARRMAAFRPAIIAFGAGNGAVVAAMPGVRASVLREMAGELVRSVRSGRAHGAWLDGEALGGGVALSGRRRQIHIVTWSKYGLPLGSKAQAMAPAAKISINSLGWA